MSSLTLVKGYHPATTPLIPVLARKNGLNHRFAFVGEPSFDDAVFLDFLEGLDMALKPDILEVSADLKGRPGADRGSFPSQDSRSQPARGRKRAAGQNSLF